MIEHHRQPPVEELRRLLDSHGVLPLQRLADDEEDLGRTRDVLLGDLEVDVLPPADAGVQGFGGGGDGRAEGLLPVVKGGLDDDRAGVAVGEPGKLLHALDTEAEGRGGRGLSIAMV